MQAAAVAVSPALRVKVGDIARVVRNYAKLGLRVTQEGGETVVDLPCGIRLFLTRETGRPEGPQTAAAAPARVRSRKDARSSRISLCAAPATSR